MNKKQQAPEATPTSPEPYIQYLGRKTSRSNSELRRRQILEADLRIVVQEGVRSIRHRSVAKEADVPLASTTYYFKDIDELIHDAFMLFAEQSLERVGELEARIYPLIEKSRATKPTRLAQRSESANQIIDECTNYLYQQVTRFRHHLIVEQAFMHEAILNETIRPLADSFFQLLVTRLKEFLLLMGSEKAITDAELIASLFFRIEYQCLLKPPKKISKKLIREPLKRQIYLTLGIKEKDNNT